MHVHDPEASHLLNRVTPRYPSVTYRHLEQISDLLEVAIGDMLKTD
jgi:hypothetical protein